MIDFVCSKPEYRERQRRFFEEHKPELQEAIIQAIDEGVTDDIVTVVEWEANNHLFVIQVYKNGKW